jgi:hypothetical protein
MAAVLELSSISMELNRSGESRGIHTPMNGMMEDKDLPHHRKWEPMASYPFESNGDNGIIFPELSQIWLYFWCITFPNPSLFSGK